MLINYFMCSVCWLAYGIRDISIIEYDNHFEEKKQGNALYI